MQGTHLLLASVFAGSACADPARDSAAETAASAQPLIPQDQFQRQAAVGIGYSLITAMMVNWVNLARSKSMAHFQRNSLAMTILDDSTLADSGSYVMTLKRPSQDSVFERGQYSARWRARAGIGTWVILEDRILPGSSRKTGSR